MINADRMLRRKPPKRDLGARLALPSAVRRAAVSAIIFLCLFLWPGLCALAHAALPVRAAILVNLDTGRVLYEQQADNAVPPASLTKIMTMFVALDTVKAGRLKLNEKIRISPRAASAGGSAMHVRAGERIPLVRLLTGMAVASGNDAATAVAERVGGNSRNFVRRMNRKARALGLRRTLFKNPTGLPAAGQKTTARDMMLLTRAYLRAHPSAMRFHGTRFFMHRGRTLRNTNALLGTVKGVNGLKTGWTVASGYNLVITAQRGKTRLLAVVLGGNSKTTRDRSARRLVEAGFRHPGAPKKVRSTLARGR